MPTFPLEPGVKLAAGIARRDPGFLFIRLAVVTPTLYYTSPVVLNFLDGEFFILRMCLETRSEAYTCTLINVALQYQPVLNNAPIGLGPSSRPRTPCAQTRKTLPKFPSGCVRASGTETYYEAYNKPCLGSFILFFQVGH